MKGKQVKKLIALIAAVTVASGSMVGCSGKEKETKKEEKIANIAMSSEPDNIDGSRGDSSAKGAIILEEMCIRDRCKRRVMCSSRWSSDWR